MKRYPETALWEELTFLAYHLHWSLADLLELEHRDRTRLIRLVRDLDRRQADRVATPTRGGTP